MRLFDVSSSKNLADRVRFSSPYTDRYIQAPRIPATILLVENKFSARGSSKMQYRFVAATIASLGLVASFVTFYENNDIARNNKLTR